jgi:CDP-diglyceride synthetase
VDEDETQRREDEDARGQPPGYRGQAGPRRTGPVRIIGAEEAAALEASQGAGRRPEDAPRYGDVPPAPEGPRPAHRFPLPESVDPADATGFSGPRAAGSDPQSPVELPHWTEPPTGEIPEVLVRERPGDEAPRGEPGVPGPTWREGERDWDDGAFDPAALGAEDTRVGALVEEEHDPMAAYSFDELDALAGGAPESPDPASGGSGGGPEDPDRQASQRRHRGSGTDAGVRQSGRRTLARTSPGRRRAGGPAQGARPSPGTAGAAADAEPGAPFDQVPGASDRGGGRPEERDAVASVSSAIAVGIVAVILFKLGSTTALMLCAAVVALAAAELFGVLRRAGYRPATLVGLVGVVGLMVAAYLKGEDAYPLVVGLVVAFSLLWFLFGVERSRPLVNLAVTLLGFAWIGVLGSFAGLLLDPRLYPNRHGVAFVFGAVIVTVAYDVAAYTMGRRFGRHPLAPQVSPAKTWEGLVGGTVAAILVGAVVVSRIHPWDLKRAVALGIVVAVVAPLGDLCESLVKRDLGTKDMGSLMPGHGGVLDRVDALLFVVPATYCLLRLLNVA